MRTDDTRDAEVIAAVRSLGTYAPTLTEGDYRVWTGRCAATYINLPNGDFVEIHDDLDGSYAAFVVTADDEYHPLSEDAATTIMATLTAAHFPVEP